MGVRAVVWDIDDTLYDYTGSDHAAALRHFAAEGLLTRYDSPEGALRHWDAVMEETYARFLAGELSHAAQRRERARAFLGVPLSDAEAEAWFGRYLVHREDTDALFPDVLPTLDTLAVGYRHGLLSNSSGPLQDRRLRAFGVRERFEVLLCCEELGCAKPAPEAFHAACAAMGLPPAAVAYVGDHPDTDAGGAHAAGLHGIWLDRGDRAGQGVGTGPATAGTATAGTATAGTATAGTATGGGPYRITSLATLPELLLSLADRPGPAPS